MVDLVVREYGIGTDTVIALHGGPAAPGDVAPLARELGESWHIYEPFQRGSRTGGAPLTVATHVQDLDDVIRERCGEQPPVLLGHSWGAMLALAHAARHPSRVAGVALIGCGTFSPAARASFNARLETRLTPADREILAQLEDTEPNPDRRRAARGRLMTRVYAYDIESPRDTLEAVDAVAHEQTWSDMLRLQHEGIYPAAFAAIRGPVLMLHGDADPHPGRLTCEDLRTYIPHLEYQEFTKCGHSPWLERHARREFFNTLNTWLARLFVDRSEAAS